MRRVNEVMREVIGSAIATELQDPRIGFVTVTAVETSPDLRSARVFVSVLGGEDEREATLAGLCILPRGAPGHDRRRAADEAHPDPELPLRRHPRARRPPLQPARPGARRSTRGGGAQRRVARGRWPQELRGRGPLPAHQRTRGPTATRSARCSRCTRSSTQLGKDSVMFLAAKEFPLPVEYRFLPLEEVFHEAAGRRRRPRRSSSSTAATSTGCRSTGCSATRRQVLNIDHHHDNTRFGDVNLVDVEASCTAEIVFELAGRLGRRAHAGDRRCALRRPRHRHGPVHVREHRRAHAPDGGRPDRGRGGRPRHLPPPLRARADREAAPDLAGDREDRALRRLRRSRSPTSRPTTTTATGASEVLTEGIIDYVRSIEGTEVAAFVRDKTDGGSRRPQGQPALDDGRRRRLRDRPRARRRRPPARRRLLDRPSLHGAGRVPLRPRSASSSTSGADSDAPAPGSCSATSPRAPPRTTSSQRCAASDGVKAGHAGTLDPFATGLSGRPARPRDAPAALPPAAAEDLRGDGAPRLDARPPAIPTAS